ncbi:viperin family antiviral radical SAM protein [Promethearchaeum syntrophicum]|uniref:Viperin family antiviral radical SAM protein n=1 Tax=Promethearchaeum syntrophicum TaxID=2594042 RepID=A0A5B9D673_9ARCH|nr:viperin family antiviral radical SAM protein [Candidatus Prometheoarchaeum syntrophicum]QEE14493.1 pyrroloquinoline quinone biosynthesis protein PqqE [Candidatus Prometheoarchaeum syntrophicum]
MENKIESVNLHITNRCNYRCKFCFARNRSLGSELNESQWMKIIDMLAEGGCMKLNFAGGEPTLIPYLSNLIQHTKNYGIFTSIISNGTGIKKKFLNDCHKDMDLIGLSLDSPCEKKELILGRTLNHSKNGRYSHLETIEKANKLIKSFNIPLKINTVLTSINWNDDFYSLITLLKPVRWKILIVHQIPSINNQFFKQSQVPSETQIDFFLQYHKGLNPIFENENILNQSYCIISPDGRFIQNYKNELKYSAPILSNGLKEGLKLINFSYNHYMSRNGDYFKQLKHEMT